MLIVDSFFPDWYVRIAAGQTNHVRTVLPVAAIALGFVEIPVDQLGGNPFRMSRRNK